jgi:hypothetical protein
MDNSALFNEHVDRRRTTRGGAMGDQVNPEQRVFDETRNRLRLSGLFSDESADSLVKLLETQGGRLKPTDVLSALSPAEEAEHEDS